MLRSDGRKLSRREYLAESEKWDEKYEWINGEIWLMSGGRPEHAAVAANLILALGRALDGRPCQVTSSGQRLHVLETDAFLYPDVAVVCGRFERSAEDRNSITNPVVVVEVLSPSTADYDRGAKFEHYIRVPTIAEVLFVDIDRRIVSVHTRRDGGWFRRDLARGGVTLASVGVEFPIEAVFVNLENVIEPQ